jgi:hypothetical protein
MNDTFMITILMIFVCTLVGSFLKGRSRDRCLKDFCSQNIRLVKKDGKKIKGKFNLESTAMAIVFEEEAPLTVAEKYSVTNHIIYKSEYGDIAYIVRSVDELTKKQKQLRDQRLKRTVKPRFFSKVARHTRTVFATIRDSVVEAFSLVMGKAKTMGGVGKFLSGQDKYVSQIQGQVTGAFGFAYEAMLERYIGKKVVFFFEKDGKSQACEGVLKEYTAEYLEILDIDHIIGEDQIIKADIIIPRALAIVRHAAL